LQGFHRRKDGSTFPVEVHLGPIEYAGRPHILASARDITQRKKTEEALRQSEARFRQVVESSPLPIGIGNEAGEIEYLNPKFVETFGYTLEDLPRMEDWFRLAYPDPAYRQNLLYRWQESMERFKRDSAATESIELEITCKDGSRRIMQGFGAMTGDKFLVVFIDLTDRKRMEEALRNSERRLSEIIDFLPDATFAIDLKGNVIAWNRAIEEMTGIKAESIIGQGNYEYALPFYGVRRPILIDLALMSDEEIEKKYVFVKREGDILLAEANVPLKGKMHLLWGKARPLYNSEGNIVGALEAIRDITERRQAEEALRQSEARFRQVVEYAPLPIAIAVEGSKMEYVNPKFVETFGYALEDLPLLEDWYRRAYPDPAYRRKKIGHWQKALEKAGAAGRPAEIFEVEVTCKDGSKKIIDIFGALVGGKTLGIFTDVTTRKHAEEALRESEARFRQVVEHSPLPIGILTGDQSEYVNPKFIETFGYTLEDLPNLAEWFRLAYPDPDYRQKIIEKWHKSLAAAMAGNRTIQGQEVEVTCKDGSVRTMEIWGVLVGGKIVAFCKDLTESRQAEEERARMEAQMREVQKLESLEVLAGGIAHDFNNLLMAILGNADLALLSLSPASPARPNIEEIIRTSQRAADLCRQMLAYSGKGRFVVGRYDLSEIVREMVQMLKVTVSKKAVAHYYFTADLPPVEVDATQMRQVIMNLITNASEALGEESGVISVTTGVRDCDRAYLADSHLDDKLPEGKYVYLEVADTGCGLDEETRRRIFDPFFTTKFAGRGLGLAAVLGIVRSHRGAIKVSSKPGEGTVFTILLPAMDWQPGDRAQMATRAAAAQRQGTILLIDDDQHVRRVAGEMLARLGLQVLTAAQGQEGLEIFRANGKGIDCVLLDLSMPGMGGEEAFQEMRRQRPDIRVILTSGYDEQEATKRFAGQGLAGFIQKPYTVAKLQEVLNRVLG